MHMTQGMTADVSRYVKCKIWTNIGQLLLANKDLYDFYGLI